MTPSYQPTLNTITVPEEDRFLVVREEERVIEVPAEWRLIEVQNGTSGE